MLLIAHAYLDLDQAMLKILYFIYYYCTLFYFLTNDNILEKVVSVKVKMEQVLPVLVLPVLVLTKRVLTKQVLMKLVLTKLVLV